MKGFPETLTQMQKYERRRIGNPVLNRKHVSAGTTCSAFVGNNVSFLELTCSVISVLIPKQETETGGILDSVYVGKGVGGEMRIPPGSRVHAECWVCCYLMADKSMLL